MKICDNGVIRDMSPEEEAAFLEWHANLPEPEEWDEVGRVLMGVEDGNA